jgi:integrase
MVVAVVFVVRLLVMSARAAERAGLAVRVTGHSLRAGLATEAHRAGHDVRTISAQTGHAPNSASLYAYLRVADRWSDNAVTGLGL